MWLVSAVDMQQTKKEVAFKKTTCCQAGLLMDLRYICDCQEAENRMQQWENNLSHFSRLEVENESIAALGAPYVIVI